MIINKFQKIIKKLPDSSGVYKFVSKNKILYVGKATNLKDRVSSYFSRDLFETRGPKIVKMIELSDDILFEKTDSVLEALILESYLIKKFQPEYNTKEKDDKSFSYVVITEEDFPRVLLIRGRDLLVSNLGEAKLGFKVKEYFGPFTSSSSIKEALKIIRRIFPFRDKCLVYDETKKSKPCFNRQIGLCPGVCSGEISKKDYQKIISNISKFFSGKKKDIVLGFSKQMKALAKRKEFEKANEIKRKIFALNHIKDISLLKNDFLDFNQDLQDPISNNFRIESYDISHIAGSDVVGVMVVMDSGELNKNEYRKFKIKNNPDNNDLKSLKEVLERRLKHSEWQMPDLIVVDGGENQRKIFEKIVKDKGFNVPVLSVVKDDRHNAREILGDKEFLKYEKEIFLSNLEAHRFALKYHKTLRNKF